MDEKLTFLLDDFPPADGAAKDSLEKLSEQGLPDDYLSFLSQMDGGEGFIGDEYLVLWKAEELADFNKEYQVEEYAPGIFLFGTGGGGEGFGFDTRNTPFQVVQIPLIGMELQYARPIATSFTHMLEQMKSS